MHGPAPLAVAIVLLLSSLVSLPAASADAANAAGFTARSIGSTDASLDGSLAGALWQDVRPDAAVPFSQWRVDAERAEAVVERTDHALVLSTGTSVVPDEPSSTASSYTGLVATFEAMSTDVRILALPAGSEPAIVRLDGGVDIEAGPAGPITHPHRAAGGAAPFSIDAAHAAEVRPRAERTQPAMATISGDVRLVVTGFLVGISSDQGPDSIDTRRQDEALDPAGTTWRTSSVEAVFDLEDAVVVVPVAVLHVGGGVVASRAPLQMQDARGTWVVRHHSLALERNRLDVTGAPTATLQRSADGLHVAMAGRIDGVAVDGQQVALSEPAKTPAPVAWIALIVLAVVTHVLLGRQLFRGIDDALERRAYGDALALVPWLRLHPWHRQDATLAAALSLTELGRAGEARARLLAPGNWGAARRPTRDFLLARAAARLGDRAESARRLAASLLADPGLLGQAKADPALAAVVGPAAGAGSGEVGGGAGSQEAYA